MISKILVAVDGSGAAQKAVNYAIELAKPLKASVFILNVIDKRLLILRIMPAEVTPRHIEEPIGDYINEAVSILTKEAKDLCEKNAVQAKIVVAHGHPVEEIVKEAEKLQVDLIIMGSHGRSAIAAAVLGSVAYGVVHNDTKIPVMIVRE